MLINPSLNFMDARRELISGDVQIETIKAECKNGGDTERKVFVMKPG